MRGVIQTPWTDDERMRLRELAAQGMSRAEIGAAMGRTKSAVHSQMRYLHIARGPRAPKPTKRPPDKRKHVRTEPHQAPATTLPPLPSLSMRGDGECS